MHRPAPRSRLFLLLGALALAGCATVGAPAPRSESAYARYAWIKDSLEAVGALDAGTLDDQEAARAPRVSLFVPPAGYFMANYVDAGFRVSDEAYVLVMTVDRDRRVRVLYPESPGESGFTAPRSATHLARFFGGFGIRTSGYASYDLSQRLSPFGAGGVLLAVASDRPLQLQRLSDVDGDWDVEQLERLVFERTLPAASQSLARALLLPGQEYSTDYLTFGGGRTLDAYRSYASGLGECASDFGLFRSGMGGYDAFGLHGFGNAGAFTRFLGFYQRDGRTFARYVSGGGCSAPVYYDVSVPRAMPGPTPGDTVRRDTAAATSRWAALRSGHDDARGTPVAVSGLRFRTQHDTPEPGSSASSRIPRRWNPAPALRPRGTPDGSPARFGTPAATPSGGWTQGVSRTEPRIQRREEVRVPRRADPQAAVHSHEESRKTAAH